MATMNWSVLLVVFIFGWHTSQAQSIGQCTDALVKSAEYGVDLCSSMQVFTKCVLRSTNIHRQVASPNSIATLQASFDQQFAQKGLMCRVNVRSIIDQLIEEDKNGVTQVTKQPTDYNHATSFGECLDTFIQNKSLTCSSMVPYLKCVLRVMNVPVVNKENYPAIQDALRSSMSQAGLSCDIDVASLFDDQAGGLHTSQAAIFEKGKNKVAQVTKQPMSGNRDTGSGLGVQPLNALVMFLVTIILVFGLY